MTEIEEAIFKTLAYSDVFNYPLTAKAVHRFLIARSPVTADFVQKTLKRASLDQKIGTNGKYYFLSRRDEIVGLREAHKQPSREKLAQAKKIAGILRFIPWVIMIGVTGKLAVADCHEDDDIDFLIVTRRKRLWLSRGLVVLTLFLLGRYRRPERVKDTICPNLFLAEDVLEWPKKNLFTAHEIVQMKPLWEKDKSYGRFIQANAWVKNFLPNAEIPERIFVAGKRRRAAPFFDSLLNFLENLAFKVQFWYMRTKKTTEVVTPSKAQFHPKDVSSWVLSEYKKRLTPLDR